MEVLPDYAACAREYIGWVAEAAATLDDIAVDRLSDAFYAAWCSGATVVLAGNGGSAATASHFANDLLKGPLTASGKPLRAMALGDCGPLVMALGNDMGFENVFAPQVRAWLGNGGLLVAISGSGNSANVLRAVETAHECGADTFALTGCGGGKLATLARSAIVVASSCMQVIEDVHAIALHAAYQGMLHRVEANLTR